MQQVRSLLSYILYLVSPAKQVYMDHAAATPLSEVSWRAMKAQRHAWGNPGSMHAHGREARAVLESSRERIARVLAVQPNDIIFCSSATEANNLALTGVVRESIKQARFIDNPKSRPHCITSAIEHSSVLEVFNALSASDEIELTVLGVDQYGHVRSEDLRDALKENTVLVSIGWANAEIGTIQSMRSLVQTVREFEKKHALSISVHTDAGQIGFAHSLQPHGTGVDLMTVSSGKMYGPRGIALLYKRYSLKLQPLMFGGHQEQGVRPGTEDALVSVGFATALEHVERQRPREYKRLLALSEMFVEQLSSRIPTAVINGPIAHERQVALPHIVNVSIPQIDSEYIVFALDHAGISVSTKSVCVEATGAPESHVVRAIAADRASDVWRASTTLRFSFGSCTTEADVRYAVQKLAEVISKHQAVTVSTQ